MRHADPVYFIIFERTIKLIILSKSNQFLNIETSPQWVCGEAFLLNQYNAFFFNAIYTILNLSFSFLFVPETISVPSISWFHPGFHSFSLHYFFLILNLLGQHKCGGTQRSLKTSFPGIFSFPSLTGICSSANSCHTSLWKSFGSGRFLCSLWTVCSHLCLLQVAMALQRSK